jgi:hypothetical protein
MQNAFVHFAIVKDEFGVTLAIVTQEDTPRGAASARSRTSFRSRRAAHHPRGRAGALPGARPREGARFNRQTGLEDAGRELRRHAPRPRLQHARPLARGAASRSIVPVYDDRRHRSVRANRVTARSRIHEKAARGPSPRPATLRCRDSPLTGERRKALALRGARRREEYNGRSAREGRRPHCVATSAAPRPSAFVGLPRSCAAAHQRLRSYGQRGRANVPSELNGCGSRTRAPPRVDRMHLRNSSARAASTGHRPRCPMTDDGATGHAAPLFAVLQHLHGSPPASRGEASGTFIRPSCRSDSQNAYGTTPGRG